MRISPVVLCCWPGLAQLWLRGDMWATATAIAFGGTLNVLLVSSCLGTLPSGVHTVAWMSASGWWLFAAIRSYRALPLLAGQIAADDRGLFIQAQGEYLRGHWFEAESLLKQLLQLRQQDVDAQLLLASLYRRTRRYDEALGRLEQLTQFEGAEKWRWEINVERRLVQRHVAGLQVPAGG